MSSERLAQAPAGSAAFFDDAADEYGAWYLAQTPGGHGLRARRERFFELLDRDSRRGRLLDIGCGPGVLTEDLMTRGHAVWGIDASPRMIEQCRRRFAGSPGLRFEVGDATRLPYPDRSFDTVVCLGVIDRVRDYEHAIAEIVRVTRPGGAVLVSFPNLYSPYAAWKRFVLYPVLGALRPTYLRLAGRPQTQSLLRAFVRLHSPRGAARMLERHGAVVTDLAYYYFNVLLSPLDDIMPRAALRLAQRLEPLRGGPFCWLGAGFVVRAERR